MGYGVIFVLLFIICALLYRVSHVFRYNVRYCTYAALVISSGLWVTPYCLFVGKPFDVRNLSAVMAVWKWAFSIFGMKVEVRNRYLLKMDSPAVIMSNHQSCLDLIAMANTCPERSSALAKKQLLYLGPFGIASWLCGLVFVDRSNKESARLTMDKTVSRILAEKIKLWVFPEGTRHLGDKFLNFKKGGFHIAVQSQVPIVPIVITSYRHFINHKKRIFNPGRLIITVLPPVPTEGLGTDDVSDLVEKVRDQMEVEFERSTKEVEELAKAHGETILH